MTSNINQSQSDAKDIAAARADVLRRAEMQGVKRFSSFEDFAGDPEMTADFDVDKFCGKYVKTATDPQSGALSSGNPSR